MDERTKSSPALLLVLLLILAVAISFLYGSPSAAYYRKGGGKARPPILIGYILWPASVEGLDAWRELKEEECAARGGEFNEWRDTVVVGSPPFQLLVHFAACGKKEVEVPADDKVPA